jgi:glycosyltransferase involved in cell wall biosynthesis
VTNAAPRVALDARILDQPGPAGSGLGRYARCLADALAAGDDVDLVLLRNLPRPPAPARYAEALEHLLLARDVRRARADVLHTPSLDNASLRPGAPLVVTLHDLAPLKAPGRYLRTGLKHRLRYAAARRADRVIVPAATVAAEAEMLLEVDARRLRVVAEAPAPGFAPVADPRAALERLHVPDRFLLWVGPLDPPDPRKGLEGLVAAARARDAGPPLVLAGRAAPTVAQTLATPGRVLLAGRVSDAELAALYTAADALVLSSLDEGYGLPAVEAMACGTPVAAYSAGALPELLAGRRGAALVDRGDAPALLDAAEALTGAEVDRPRRTWADVAAETAAVYRELA